MILRHNNKILRHLGNVMEYSRVDASGGLITYDGDYKIHMFNVSDNFIVNIGGDVSTLIVGGGGGCPGSFGIYSTGAGGGGQVKQQNITLIPNIYPVIVGLGDHDSIFAGITSNKGQRQPQHDETGATSGSGNVGGNSPYYFISGGGGGDSHSGYDASTSGKGGDGGEGTHSSISGTDVGYGGGGGGGGYLGSWPSFGGGLGIDGGGYGGDDNTDPPNPGHFAQNGSTNTGGGGGSEYQAGGNYATLGGSGVVIIRYKYK